MIYKYIGKGTPTEFIAEEGTERDYYTKIETNNLLDKKQDKLIAGENIKIDENNKISATGGSGESLWEMDPNSPNIIQPKEKRIITLNNTRIVDIADPQQEQDAVNKRYVDSKIQPIPSIPQWKEVGIISNKNQFITYDFKPNKEYRLSFTWLPHDINNSVIQFLNFYILKEKTPFSVLQTFYQEKNADLKLCISNNLIAVLNYNNEKIDNCLYKLEELQE